MLALLVTLDSNLVLKDEPGFFLYIGVKHWRPLKHRTSLKSSKVTFGSFIKKTHAIIVRIFLINSNKNFRSMQQCGTHIHKILETAKYNKRTLKWSILCYYFICNLYWILTENFVLYVLIEKIICLCIFFKKIVYLK